MVGAGLLLGLPMAALAEKSDREKPIQADADKLTLDNAQKLSIFEGNVVIIQGSLRITADRVVLKEEKDGSRHASGIGKQATFRQKRDDVDEYVDGTADRFEFDGKTDRLELFGHANLKRAQDDIRGEYISYDTRTEFFRVNGSAGSAGTPGPGTGGRVHVTIQPTQQPDAVPAQPLNLKRDPPASAAHP
jgi:lipopolysaccharide export system protein LptA